MGQVIGIIPARMASTRFPGKPMHLIDGVPMVRRVYDRATIWKGWNGLYVSSPDYEILSYCVRNGIDAIHTSDRHVRALDRVAEAVNILRVENATVINVQGDEPMLEPDDIDAVCKSVQYFNAITVLALPVHGEAVTDPNTVKIVRSGLRFIYSSRCPVPYGEGEHLRIGGIFGFPQRQLEIFANGEQTPLEERESCDMNRAIDMGLRPRIVIGKSLGLSVDCPADAERVEAALRRAA